MDLNPCYFCLQEVGMYKAEVEKDKQQLCLALGINYDPLQQDWGIENADPKRVEEFMDHFIANSLPQYIQYIVFELVIASYNEFILSGLKNPELEYKFINFIRSHSNGVLDDIVRYWKSICDSDGFPVGKLL